MSSQKVTEKILADAKEEAGQILERLENEAKQISDDYAERAAKKKAQDEEEIQERTKTEIMRALSQRRLDLNKSITGHKQKTITEVINESVAQLVARKEYADFLKALIRSSHVKEGNLMLSKNDAKKHRNELEKYIRDEGLNIKISANEELTGGIIIEKEKTRYIGSLDIILELLSEELSIVISKELFQTQGKG